MKKIVLVLGLILILSINNFSQQGWVNIFTFEGEGFGAICFIDSLNGFAGSINSNNIKSIIKTIDAGYTWEVIKQTDASVYRIYFINHYLGFAVCEDSKIFKSTDSGENWNLIQLNETDYVFNVFFLNENLGWACVGTNKIYKTTDGGLNWTYSITANVIANRDIVFINENIGYVVGLYGVMLKSTDGGLNWVEVIPPSTSSMFDIEFVDDTVGYLVGGDWIAKTTNGGNNWNIIQSSGGIQLNSITTYDKKYAWVAGTDKIYYTSNSGSSWSPQAFTPYSYLLQVTCVDSVNVWLLGDKKLYRTISGGVLEINDDINRTIESFGLSQNYPNPFNPSTKISWQAPLSGWQSLKVYDVLGREVATLVNEYRKAGSNEIDFDASKLSSGVYFYQLKADKYLDTKKMILIK